MSIVIIVFNIAFCSESRAENLFINTDKQKLSKADLWLAEDKARHIIGSFMTTILFAKTHEHIYESSEAKSQVFGASIGFTLGITKEVRDHFKKNNQFSWKDMTANVVGIVCAILILGID